MKLYHFTSRHHIQGCIKEGLKRGMIPLSLNPPKLISGFQWLTKNKSFDQSWCKHSTLPYKREEYRITIRIPKSEKKKLIKWLLYCEKTKLKSADVLNAFGDPENWYLFKGVVKPEWFKKVSRNPKENRKNA